MSFTEAEREYLASMPLGRLATVAGDGVPQNNPVGFRLNDELGTIDIGGHAMGASRKFANVRQHPDVSFVVDDIRSTNPWSVRGVEIRGTAEALSGQEPAGPGYSPEIIRIHPRRVLSWGLGPDGTAASRRTIRD